ncbi:prolyl-tRNA synthetase [Pleomassaria siparia CBS 279.74]|uniref:proline--tRNA ligase n=1 Tax=Pleomassaria siparia CBS 279.74 TaxID=1314801 RepID=A0A6G1JWB7_9PLEO|nr:prolyl-tRNA synthetase [Pleomassaria siparia CBS 279.74]
MTAPIWQALCRAKVPIRVSRHARCLTIDSRNRLSKFWAPTGGITPQHEDGEKDDSNALLVQAGFLRQTHSGIFHLLPLGLRVQNKLESLIDKHMSSLGASKLSLSSITTEALWKKSGRLNLNTELFNIGSKDQISDFLLSPTHEEEITSLVSGMVKSYKDVPLRLYQVGRKYRNELRPRGGLLRAREFMMKDLYTFDYSSELALETYQEVRAAYNNLFDELKVPYLVADADSGNMGGKLSHEYHFASPKGEDDVWKCNTCEFVVNDELVEKGVEDGDICPRCPPNTGHLTVRKAIEVAHTFHLGTRYSEPLGALVTTPKDPRPQPLHMGCHGIGVSRLIGAVASILSDSKGLNWPRAIAPFEVIIIGADSNMDMGEAQFNHLSVSDETGEPLDVAWDDRPIKSMGWKLRDADLIGYPVILVLGRAWKERGAIEVQCRRLGIKKEVDMASLKKEVTALLDQL